MRALLVMMLLPAVALADTGKLRTRVTIDGENEAVRAAFGEAMRTKLDACWKKPTRAKARLTFDAGKVTGVELSVKPDPATVDCVTAALKTATLAATAGRMVATIELETTADPPVSLFKKGNRKVLENVIDRKVDLGTFTGIKGTGSGAGTSTNSGAGAGTGRISDGRKDGVDGTGPTDAPIPPRVTVGPSQAHEGSLSMEQIDRVIRARAGIFRACYQKELRRNAALAGKVIVRFAIDGNGTVKVATVSSTTLASKPVEDCIVRNVQRLQFPAIGATANVTYPFVFAPQ